MRPAAAINRTFSLLEYSSLTGGCQVAMVKGNQSSTVPRPPRHASDHCRLPQVSH